MTSQGPMEVQAGGDPVTMDRPLGDAKDLGGFDLGQSLVPQHVEHRTLAVGQAADPFVKLAPECEPTRVGRRRGRAREGAVRGRASDPGSPRPVGGGARP